MEKEQLEKKLTYIEDFVTGCISFVEEDIRRDKERIDEAAKNPTMIRACEESFKVNSARLESYKSVLKHMRK